MIQSLHTLRSRTLFEAEADEVRFPGSFTAVQRESDGVDQPDDRLTLDCSGS